PLNAPQAARAPVPDEVGFVESGIVCNAEALGRATPPVLQLLSTGIRLLMRIFGDRQDADDRALLARAFVRVALGSLIQPPAVILSAFRRSRLAVDLFPVVLADICYEKVARNLIEMEHVWIAKAISPNFRPRSDLDLVETFLGDSE